MRSDAAAPASTAPCARPCQWPSSTSRPPVESTISCQVRRSVVDVEALAVAPRVPLHCSIMAQPPSIVRSVLARLVATRPERHPTGRARNRTRGARARARRGLVVGQRRAGGDTGHAEQRADNRRCIGLHLGRGRGSGANRPAPCRARRGWRVHLLGVEDGALQQRHLLQRLGGAVVARVVQRDLAAGDRQRALGRDVLRQLPARGRCSASASGSTALTRPTVERASALQPLAGVGHLARHAFAARPWAGAAARRGRRPCRCVISCTVKKRRRCRRGCRRPAARSSAPPMQPPCIAQMHRESRLVQRVEAAPSGGAAPCWKLSARRAVSRMSSSVEAPPEHVERHAGREMLPVERITSTRVGAGVVEAAAPRRAGRGRTPASSCSSAPGWFSCMSAMPLRA